MVTVGGRRMGDTGKGYENESDLRFPLTRGRSLTLSVLPHILNARAGRTTV